jgi:hypothetical protein
MLLRSFVFLILCCFPLLGCGEAEPPKESLPDIPPATGRTMPGASAQGAPSVPPAR